MLTKNDFLPADWVTIRDVPHWVGLATLAAGASGLGTVKESVALAQGIVEGQSSDVPLLRDLANRVEMQDAQNSMRDTLEVREKISPDGLKRLALERVGAAMSLLDGKASPEEISALRRWLYSIAEKVAKAASEGGFLGFGGTQVSGEEQAFLDELRSALQLQSDTA